MLPRTLLGRLSAALVVAILLSQFIGNLIWITQSRAKAELETTAAARSVAHSAAGAIRFFMSLPAVYHPVIIQQFRDMGGTGFFATINRAPVQIKAIDQQLLADRAVGQVRSTLLSTLPNARDVRIALSWPDDLRVSDAGATLADLPESWVQHILLPRSKPAPILVIQVELAEHHWLYLATLMPNPYFLEGGTLLTGERLMLQGMTLSFVLLVTLVVVRRSTYPLAKLSTAAEAFGRGEPMPPLPEHGSREFVQTARAFRTMSERIKGYIEDRERLFVGISHDLRTPIMRLKLRAELLDDDATRAEFHEDLDELDMMLKAALQNVRDSSIHENSTSVGLHTLLVRMVRDVRLAGHVVRYGGTDLRVRAKPFALKRAIGNLLDNALHYGEEVEINVLTVNEQVAIEVRDRGPGVPDEALAKLFTPYVRLDHGRHRNHGGTGLGLGIARWLVQGMDGDVRLANRAGGGLTATILVPCDTGATESL